MGLSDLSIRRPVLATVMSLLIVLGGLAAYRGLAVREYPDVDYPVVSVSVTYTGASPQTVESSVIEPLEQAFNGVEDIRSIRSTAAFGGGTIDVEFLPGRDIDRAVNDVTNAVQQVAGRLPDDAERPIVSKSGANTWPIIWLDLSGEGWSLVDLTDVADRQVKTPLQLLPGVANVIIGGERRYAMRVWLDPERMAARGVDPSDIRRTLQDANLQLPAGEVEGAARKYTVLADAQIADPAVYESLVVRQEAAGPVRLRDVGWVELGSENYDTVTRFDRKPIIGLGIVRQSRANQLEVSDAVRAALPAIQRSLPPGVRLNLSIDDTIFVRASLAEVWKTIGIALVLVVLVNFVFLRSLPTTVIPSVAIPVALIGTFAAMWALGFSVNVLTLLAMVLAIGVLVDDAIVVMENCYRRQELGEPREIAALRGARQVAFPVIATTVSLVAVFIPLSLLTGSTGRLFREFSITMAVSILISMFVALSLTPMMCSRLLTVATGHGRLFEAVEGFFRGLTRAYDRGLAWALRHRRTIAALLALNVAASAVLFWIIPATLVPTEDRGDFITIIRAPQGSTVAYTFETLQQVEDRIARIPEVDGSFSAIGLPAGGPPSTEQGIVFTRLKPWDQRSVKQQEIVAGLFPEFMSLPGALVFPVNIPSLGQESINDVEVVVKSSFASLDDFAEVTGRILERARGVPGLVNLDTNLRLDNPQLEIAFDRERAADLGIPVRSVAEALQILLAQTPTTEFVLRNKQYDVLTAVASRFRSVPEQLEAVHVRGRDGAMVPLSALIRAVPSVAPATLNHWALERSATITGGLGPGATLGPVLEQVLAIAREELPPGFSTALAGVSREFAEATADVYLAFVLALGFVYLVLAGQFESFVHPLVIMVSVPLALFGALATLWLTGNTMNLYSQIGIILLVGLVTKNAILLVEYANQSRARGAGLVDAVVRAGHDRFRPILMTSVTSILGAMPLMLAAGAGAESRRPIGAAVVGGLLFSTVFTLLVVPVVYLLLVRVAERFGLRTVPPPLELEDDAAAAA